MPLIAPPLPSHPRPLSPLTYLFPPLPPTLLVFLVLSFLFISLQSLAAHLSLTFLLSLSSLTLIPQTYITPAVLLPCFSFLLPLTNVLVSFLIVLLPFFLTVLLPSPLTLLLPCPLTWLSLWLPPFVLPFFSPLHPLTPHTISHPLHIIPLTLLRPAPAPSPASPPAASRAAGDASRRVFHPPDVLRRNQTYKSCWKLSKSLTRRETWPGASDVGATKAGRKHATKGGSLFLFVSDSPFAFAPLSSFLSHPPPSPSSESPPPPTPVRGKNSIERRRRRSQRRRRRKKKRLGGFITNARRRSGTEQMPDVFACSRK